MECGHMAVLGGLCKGFIWGLISERPPPPAAPCSPTLPILTAVLFLSEGTDHVAGVHKSQELWRQSQTKAK